MQRLGLYLSLVITFCLSAVSNAEELKIATGHTFIKLVFDPLRSDFADKTGIDLRILFNGPLPALAELEKGLVDAAGASMELEEWLAAARKAGVPVKESSTYNSYVPFTEKAMIVVNSENSVKKLTKEQLKGIFTGTILNWQEVGGNDAPILVVWPTISSGAMMVFKAKIMDNEPITKNIFDVESIGDTADSIISTPEAIGIISGTSPKQGLKEVAPALERPLTLVYKGKPGPNLQKLLDFIKSEGKPYIK